MGWRIIITWIGAAALAMPGAWAGFGTEPSDFVGDLLQLNGSVRGAFKLGEPKKECRYAPPAIYGLDSLEPDPTGFCRDPFGTVCGHRKEVSDRRDEQLQAFRQRFRGESILATAAKYGFSPATVPALLQYEKTHGARGAEAFREYIQGVRDRVLKEVGENKWYQKLDFWRIQRNLIAVIGAQAGLDEPTRAAMIGRVEKLELVDAAEFLKDHLGNQELQDHIEQKCFRDGLIDNAFQWPGTNYLVLCPGALLAARRDPTFTVSDSNVFQDLAHTLAHESGHTVDTQHFKAALGALQGCMLEQYGRSFPKVVAAQGPTAKSAAMDGYLDEITADTWAAESLAYEMRKTGDPVEGYVLLWKSAASLCGFDKDDGEHPADAFRINVILGRNPRIRAALGCGAPTEAEPSCVIEGRVPAKTP